MLVVAETHPVQYRAPVYRCLAQEFNVPLTVVYGSDFSVAGYEDDEFGASVRWDTDLLGGYESRFLSRRNEGGPADYQSVTATGLADALDEIQPSAVLTVGYMHPLNRTGILHTLRRNWPLLIRAETTDHASQRNLFKQLVRDTLLRQVYKRSTALLYLGKRSRAHYEKRGVPDSKLIFSPYCVDASTFQTTPEDRVRLRAETRKELGIPDNERVIIYSGKMSERKGVDLFVETVKQLPETERDRCTILFLGEGALRPSLEELVAAAPRVKTHFLGFQNQSQLSRYYHAADLQVVPSRRAETWGLVVNEGLIHGLPCVVSDAVGCHPDLVEPGVTGEVFPPDDVASFISALLHCLEYATDPATRENCRAKVAEYSIRNAAKGISEAFTRAEAASERRP